VSKSAKVVLDVTARILLNGDFTFCPIYDFKELGVAKKRA